MQQAYILQTYNKLVIIHFYVENNKYIVKNVLNATGIYPTNKQ